MNHPQHQPIPAIVDQQIDIALEFVSAVQHLSRYHRLGLSLAEAIEEAANEADGTVVGTAGPGDPVPHAISSLAAAGSPTSVVLLISSLDAWTQRMATAFNDDEPWPHPQPAKGWPSPAT